MLKVKGVTLPQAKAAYSRTQMKDSGMTVLEKVKRGRGFITWAKNIYESDETGLLAYYLTLGLARAEAMMRGEQPQKSLRLNKMVVKKVATTIGLLVSPEIKLEILQYDCPEDRMMYLYQAYMFFSVTRRTRRYQGGLPS